MKKVITILLVLVLSVGFVFANGSSETAAAEKTSWKVAGLSMGLDGYWSVLLGFIKDACAKENITMDLFSGDYNSVTQVQQIENAVIQGYDAIFLIAVEPEAVADACKKAIDAGVPVYQFIKDSGEENRTSFRGTDENIIGSAIAEYASDWALSAGFSETNKANVIVIGGNSAGSETERYEAVVKSVNANPVFNVIETTRVETTQLSGQTTTENLVAKYGTSINIYIYCSVEMGSGGVTYLESEASPYKGDYSKLGVFCGGVSQECADDMWRVAEGKGCVRGMINTGGSNEESAVQIATQLKKILTGQSFEAFDLVQAVRVSTDNLEVLGYPKSN